MKHFSEHFQFTFSKEIFMKFIQMFPSNQLIFMSSSKRTTSLGLCWWYIDDFVLEVQTSISSFLKLTSSLLKPTSSLLNPTSSFLKPTSSLLKSDSSLLKLISSFLKPTSSFLKLV
ncbi:hypothetical protein ACKWTF_000479 [Chironomus riparius]